MPRDCRSADAAKDTPQDNPKARNISRTGARKHPSLVSCSELWPFTGAEKVRSVYQVEAAACSPELHNRRALCMPYALA